MANERKQLNPRDLSILREFKAKHLSREDLQRWGAHSMGIGRKVTKGKLTDQICIRIYVSCKFPREQLQEEQLVPPYFSFKPEKAKRETRIYTDLIAQPPARFEPVDPETMIRPAPGGVSGGIIGSTGTIGGYVWDNTDDSIVMLSNHHVFGHTTGTTIIQQGSADGGSTPANDFGEVKRGVPRVSGGPVNIVDCAIGDPDDSNDIELSVLEIGPAVYAIDEVADDMLVEKYGQTTRHTYGEVTDADWEGWVSGYYFEQCFRVDARAPSSDWSAGGDSGSLVFSQTPIEEESEIKPVVGLHFAGASTYGIGCRIQNVFRALNLTTLCSGAFSAFLDSLFERDAEEESVAYMAHLAARRPVPALPQAFLKKERLNLQSRNPYAGLSRSIQQKLMGSKQGKIAVDFINQNRHELLTLTLKDADFRRSAIKAVSTMAQGVTTSSEFLEKPMGKQDVENIARLAKEASRHGSRKMKVAINALLPLLKKAEGKNLASLLQLKG